MVHLALRVSGRLLQKNFRQEIVPLAAARSQDWYYVCSSQVAAAVPADVIIEPPALQIKANNGRPIAFDSMLHDGDQGVSSTTCSSGAASANDVVVVYTQEAPACLTVKTTGSSKSTISKGGAYQPLLTGDSLDVTVCDTSSCSDCASGPCQKYSPPTESSSGGFRSDDPCWLPLHLQPCSKPATASVHAGSMEAPLTSSTNSLT